MNVFELFPPPYLAAAQLEGDLTLTMDTVTVEEMGQPPKTERKPVLSFTDHDKGLVLNKTNTMTIAGMYGPETNNWKGKQVTLYSEKVNAFGSVQDAIRIRDRDPLEYRDRQMVKQFRVERAQAQAPNPNRFVPPEFDPDPDLFNQPEVDFYDEEVSSQGEDSRPSLAQVRAMFDDFVTSSAPDLVNFLDAMRAAHSSSKDKPLSEKQYGALAGMLDSRYKSDLNLEHGQVLSVILGDVVNAEHRPGWRLAGRRNQPGKEDIPGLVSDLFLEKQTTVTSDYLSQFDILVAMLAEVANN